MLSVVCDGGGFRLIGMLVFLIVLWIVVICVVLLFVLSLIVFVSV